MAAFDSFLIHVYAEELLIAFPEQSCPMSTTFGVTGSDDVTSGITRNAKVNPEVMPRSGHRTSSGNTGGDLLSPENHMEIAIKRVKLNWQWPEHTVCQKLTALTLTL